MVKLDLCVVLLVTFQKKVMQIRIRRQHKQSVTELVTLLDKKVGFLEAASLT